jgi:hypothetical protein
MTSNLRRAVGAACLAGAFALAGNGVLAQDAPNSIKDATEAVKAAGSADVVDPASIEALKAMGAYLSQIRIFDLTTSFETDIGLDNGQKVEVGGTARYLVRRPDRLRVELTSDLGQRNFYYDGQSLVVVSPDNQVYGQIDDVGPTIKEMLASVAAYADIELPLSDLFSWGAGEGDPTDLVKEGFLVGTARMGDYDTKHWAFRTEKKDFQIWIKEGNPLPVKLVITDNTDPAKPRFETNLLWSTALISLEDEFNFLAPQGFSEIPFVMHEPEEAPKEEAK